MSSYQRPQKALHRGFFYLDDEIVTNSLSAIESGKIDEVVAKIVSAREGGVGLGGRIGLPAHAEIKAEGGRKTSSSLEESLVTTRTRFSVFEIWYKMLQDAKAIGRFTSWDMATFEDISPGDTLEFPGALHLPPLQAVYRMFAWYASEAKKQGGVFSQKGEQLKDLKDAERNFQLIMKSGESSEIVLSVEPCGESAPHVIMRLSDESIIGKVGQMGGSYQVIAQVDKLIPSGVEEPVLRLTNDAPPLPLELKIMQDIVGNFVEPARELGAVVSTKDAAISGPAMVITPIAIYR